MKETSNEMWEKCQKILGTLSKDKLGIEKNIIIKRAYRTRSSPEGRRSKSTPILCKFHSYNDKIKVFQNTKKLEWTNISINEDFRQTSIS